MTTTAITQAATFDTDTGRSPKIREQAVLVIMMPKGYTYQTSDICTTISALDERSEEGVVDVSPVEEASGANAHFEMVNGSDSFITWPLQEENITLSASSNVICQATDESNSSLIVMLSNSIMIPGGLEEVGNNACISSWTSPLLESAKAVLTMLEESLCETLKYYLSSKGIAAYNSAEHVSVDGSGGDIDDDDGGDTNIDDGGDTNIDDVDDGGGICVTKGSNGDGDYGDVAKFNGGISCGKF